MLLICFVKNNLCMIGTKDQSYYYDDNHLSEFGAQKLLGVLNKILIHEHQ